MNAEIIDIREYLPHKNNKGGEEGYERMDETDDKVFYATDRFVEHLDTQALRTVEEVIGTLVVEKDPVILDLMASWDSHISKNIRPSEVVGLGLNERELSENAALTNYVIHDLNKDPRLPFEDAYFDVVLNTVSVDYVTNPTKIFQEAERILKPGGLFLVIFSNRFFPEKVVKIWREATEEERIFLVEELFKRVEGFEHPRFFISKGQPRPKTDKYAHLGVPSDPIYAVYANKEGGDPALVRPDVSIHHSDSLDKEELKKRTEAIKHTMRCPHCDQKLSKWQVPQTPFTEWESEFVYVCFNDACPYLLRGWDVMSKQGNWGMSYRLMYDPARDRCHPFPVPTLSAFKESIVE